MERLQSHLCSLNNRYEGLKISCYNIGYAIVLLLAFHSFTYSQLRIDKVVPPSFNAVATLKYCDHPVGTKYGIPKIKYGIKTLSNKDLYIPVSLNYHSLGTKVEEESTWAGLGWQFNAGGMITRIIRGENDFAAVEEIDQSEALGYPFEHIKPCFDNCEENESEEFHQKVCAGQIDSDPDIFFFDILGRKGKFLLTPDHSTDQEFIEINIVRPFELKVRYYLAVNSWIVHDSRGYKYTFATREITNTYDNYFDYRHDSHKLHFLNNENSATTSWYLDKIESPAGANAEFIYSTSTGDQSPYRSNSTRHKMNINDDVIWDLHYSSYCFPDHIENVQIVSENQHQDVYLEKILCGDWEATFYKSEQEVINPYTVAKGSQETQSNITGIAPGYGPQQLNSIEIRQKGEVITKGKFFYSFFNESVQGDTAYLYQRLRLDSLSITNNGKQKGYGFSYEQSIQLPSKESHARDIWGFYNGEEDLYNITPSDFFNYSQPEKLLQEEGKARHYSLPHIQAGILNKIDYGNQRVREYIYEQQEFQNIDAEISDYLTEKLKNSNFSHDHKPFLFGGLRLKEIHDTYPTEKMYKEFNYKPDGQETGKLIISHYNHDHHGFGHKTSGNHSVKYEKVRVKTGKIFRGTKF